MNEREKMLSGRLYDPYDPALVSARAEARRLTRRLGELDPADVDGQRRLLEDLCAAVGAGATVVPPLHCDYGTQIRLGSRVYVNAGCTLLDAAPITFGDDVQLGPGVQLLTSDHPRDALERARGLETAAPITVGARVWLGSGVIVLPGVEIGAEVIVGAGSVVTSPLEPGVTAAGNPCRVISRR
jgi:maltose O-acetyltransferase